MRRRRLSIRPPTPDIAQHSPSVRFPQKTLSWASSMSATMRCGCQLGRAVTATAAAASRAAATTTARATSAPRVGPSSRTLYTSAPLVDRVNFYDHSIERYALMEGNSLPLSELLRFGRVAAGVPRLAVRSARYVQSELPIRLARRLMDLQFLPYVVVTNPHVAKVYKAYLHAFNTLRRQEPVTGDTNAAFTALLRTMVDEHAPMIAALGLGLKECSRKPIVGEQLHLDAFLDTMLRSRIERRVLGEHHIALQHRRNGWVGVMNLGVGLVDALEHAKERVAEVCRQTYAIAPEITIVGDLGATCCYIPAHLDYCLFEILKNATRAVVERHSRGSMSRASSVGSGANTDASLPPVVLHICEGSSGVTIKVSDQGGGIRDDEINRIWQYGYTTFRGGESAYDDDETDVNVGAFHGVGGLAASSGTAASSPMAGLGFGLPLSRLYARFLGGDIRLVSLPGYGSDVYISIPDLSDDKVTEEILI